MFCQARRKVSCVRSSASAVRRTRRIKKLNTLPSNRPSSSTKQGREPAAARTASSSAVCALSWRAGDRSGSGDMRVSIRTNRRLGAGFLFFILGMRGILLLFGSAVDALALLVAFLSLLLFRGGGALERVDQLLRRQAELERDGAAFGRDLRGVERILEGGQLRLVC